MKKWLSTTHWHLPSTSTGIKSWAVIAADFQCTLKGVQGRDQTWSPLWCKQNWQNMSSDIYFQEVILWDQFLYFLRSRKALKPFMVMPAPYDQLEPSAKEYVLDCMNLPFTKITHTQTFPHSSLEQFLRAFWHTVSQDAVLILCQRKLSSQPSSCAAAFESAWLWLQAFTLWLEHCNVIFF